MTSEETDPQNEPEVSLDDDQPGRTDYAEGRLLSAQEAASWLGMTPRSVRRAFAEGRLPYVRVAKRGRFVRFEDVRAYSEQRKDAERPRIWDVETVDSRKDDGTSAALVILRASLEDVTARLESAQAEAFSALRDLVAERGRAERAEAELQAERTRADRAEADLAAARKPLWRRLFG